MIFFPPAGQRWRKFAHVGQSWVLPPTCKLLIIALGTNYSLAERKCFFHFSMECDIYTYPRHTPTLTHPQTTVAKHKGVYVQYIHTNLRKEETH